MRTVLRLALPPRLPLAGALLAGASLGCVLALAAAVSLVRFRALPFPAGDRLVRAYESERSNPELRETTWANYKAWRPDRLLLDAMGAYETADRVLADARGPRSWSVSRISASLLPTLGLAAVRGRAFRPADEPASSPVVMLAFRTWVAEFAGDERIVGSAIALDGMPFVVVGIAPPELASMLEADVLMPLPPPPPGRDDRMLRVVGRLKAGATLADSRQRFDAEVAALRNASPDNARFDRGVLVPLREALAGDLSPVVGGLTALGAFLLVITVVNALGLGMAGAERLRHEIGVRMAVGATRTRLAAEALRASVLPATVTAAGTLVACWWLLAAARGASRQRLLAEGLRLDGTTAWIGAGAAFVLGAAATVYPRWRLSGGDLAREIAGNVEAARHAAGAGLLRPALVVLQTATALIFAVVAVTCVADVWRATGTGPGFDVRDLWCVDVKTTTGTVAPVGSQGRELVALASALAGLPGVTRAAVTNDFPVTLEPGSLPFRVRDANVAPGDLAELEIVTPGYVETLGLPVREGRTFAGNDVRGGRLVAMVNRAFASRYWPGRSGVGRAVGLGQESPWFTVVGVADNVRPVAEHELARPRLYLCALQVSSGGESVAVIRAAPGTTLQARAVVAALRALGPSLAVGPVRRATAVADGFRRPKRLAAVCLTMLAVVATMLAGAGVFGLVASSVARRRRELALRRALGAGERRLALAVVSGVGWQAALGVAVGACGARAAHRFYSTSAQGGAGGDPWLLAAGIGGVLMAIVAAAALSPAWSAVTRPLAAALRRE